MQAADLNIVIIDERTHPEPTGLVSTPGLSKYILRLTDEYIQLEHQSKNQKFSPFRIDFNTSQFNHRRKMTTAMREPIAKAVGITKNNPLKILDLTAGIGRDAFILACYGANLTLLESNPIVGLLLEDAIKRGKETPDIAPILNRMSLYKIDALQYMMDITQSQSTQELLLSQDISTSCLFDVIYFDPMFPDNKKSAKSKKELQILQELVPITEESLNAQIADQALILKPKRLVIKRPKSAPYILKAPNAQQIYDTIRFDIYFP